MDYEGVENVGLVGEAVGGEVYVDENFIKNYIGLLPNSLVSDYQYYCITIRGNPYTVVYYENQKFPDSKVSLVSTEFQYLTNPRGWPNDVTVDSFSLANLRLHHETWKDVLVLPVQESRYIVGADADNNVFRGEMRLDSWVGYQLESRGYRYILLPFSTGGHWLLWVLNVREESAFYLDPYGTDYRFEELKGKFRRYLDDFRERKGNCEGSFLYKINWNIIIIKFKPRGRPLQFSGSRGREPDT